MTDKKKKKRWTGKNKAVDATKKKKGGPTWSTEEKGKGNPDGRGSGSNN